ncbi:unnamed protein product [Hermetia illucens]|uniref:Uncharacterized protein n=1 Tax=Hermetia illucens TaxID=343691 RepID=A0A7R8UYF1_HERIL|nr:unnamed protein product [Hermetia illucens]
MASNVTIDQDIRRYIEDVLKEANQVDNKKRKRKNVEEDSRLKDFDLVDKLHQTKKRKMDDVYRRSQGPARVRKLYQPKNKIQGPTRNDVPEYANFKYPCLMAPITFKYIGRTSEPTLDFNYLLNKSSEEKGKAKDIVESGEESSDSSQPAEEAAGIMDSPMVECIAIIDDTDPEESGSPKGIVESGEESSEPLQEAESNVDSPKIECIAIDDDTDPEESELNRTDIFVSDEEGDLVIVLDD